MAQTKTQDAINAVIELISQAKNELKKAEALMQHIASGNDIDLSQGTNINDILSSLPSESKPEGETEVVEGVFDGYFMVGANKKKYPVPMNYASKTKLIPGDVLKLRIMTDGKLIYKLIHQAPRSYVKATLSKSDDNKYTAVTDEGTMYYLNQAAVSYYRGNTGDELSIIINSEGIGQFAAIEALIHSS